MGKFCTKCGRPLQEGQICVCQLPAGGQSIHRQATAGQLSPTAQQSQADRQAELRRQYEARKRQAERLAGTGQLAGQRYGTGQSSQRSYGSSQTNGQVYGTQQQAAGGYNGRDTQQASRNAYDAQQQNYSAQRQPLNQQRAYQATSEYAQNFFGTVIQLIQHPVTFGRKLILEADVKKAIILMVLQGICSGLFALAASHKFSGYIKAGVGLAGGLDSSTASAVTGLLEMPYIRTFIVTVIFSVALACVYALLLYVGHRIIKAPATLPQMLSTVAIRSAIMAPAILISLLVFEISMMPGIALFTYTNLLGFAAVIIADCVVFGQRKADAFVFMAGIVIILFVFVIIFSFSKVFTLYLPDVIRTSLKSIGDLSGQELLEEIFDSF